MKSDEEIFADKEKELNQLKENINELESKLSIANRCLEASLNKEKEQQDLMLQLQIQIDKLMSSKKQFEATNKIESGKQNNMDSGVRVSSNRGPNNSQLSAAEINAKQRAKTAPQSNSSMINPTNQVAKRNRAAYSSPAVFTLERFMQSFRARSQLLTETLEENDCVLQKETLTNQAKDENLLDNDMLEYGIDENILIKDNDEDGGEDEVQGFVRKGTFKVNKPKSKQPLSNITDYEKVDNKTSELLATGQDQSKKLRDLSINVK